MTGQHVRDDALMREVGARWCEAHDRWECGGRRQGHDYCHGIAIGGTSRCRMHAGKSSALAKAQGEANRLAWSTAAAAGAMVPALDPGTAVMDQLRVAVLRADIYGELLRVQVMDGEDDDGLVGSTFAAGRDGHRVETGEAVRALARLEAEWRDRVVRFAKAAHDMGIAERHIELQQAQAQIVVAAARAGLDAVGEGLSAAGRDAFLRAFLGSLGQEQPVPAVVAGSVDAPGVGS